MKVFNLILKQHNGLPHNRRRDYDFLKGYTFGQSLARNLNKATSASAVNAVVSWRPSIFELKYAFLAP
jgi:hypothetical protein